MGTLRLSAIIPALKAEGKTWLQIAKIMKDHLYNHTAPQLREIASKGTPAERDLASLVIRSIEEGDLYNLETMLRLIEQKNE
jgi:hypothetical protein